MNFILTNEHRKYFGLKPLNDSWEMKIIKNRSNPDIYKAEYYVFFDKSAIKKIIKYDILKNNYYSMRESDVNYQTNDEYTIVYPKTSKGKERKLNFKTVDSFNGEGTYFAFSYNKKENKSDVIIGNYTTQKSFYEEFNIQNYSFEDLPKWCDNFVANATDEDLKEIWNFSNEKRCHINYQEGDYFRARLGKNKYTYGRILMDIYKREKRGMIYYPNLFGRPLIVEVFHILTDRKDVTISELKKLKTFPSQHIMDNKLYYGEFTIIGKEPFEENMAYPIMCGRHLDENDNKKLYFQWGKLHIEIPYKKNSILNQNMQNAGIGFYLNVTPELIEKCLKNDSNKPFWDYYAKGSNDDLRSPQNRKILKKVLKEINYEELYILYDKD